MSNDYRPGTDPNYQEALLQYLMGMGGLQLPPELMAMGINTQPSFTPAQMGSMTGAVPGNLDPTKQANYLQDQIDLMMDPAVAAMYGGGAYSPDAFAPEVEYTPITSPGRQRLQNYITNSPGSIEAYFAEQILGGGTASQAVAELKAAYEASPENPEVSGLMSQLMLPTDEFSGDLDWSVAQDQARALEMTFLEDPTPGAQPDIVDPRTGEVISGGGEIIETMDSMGNPVLMRVETEDSPMAEWYRERGLSLPTDQYEAADFLGQGWMQGQAEFDQVYNDYLQSQDQFVQGLQQQQESPSAERDAANLFAGGVYMGGGQPGQRPGATGETYNAQGQLVYDPLSSANPGSRAMAQNERQATDEAYYDRGPNGEMSQAELDQTGPDPFVQYMQATDGTIGGPGQPQQDYDPLSSAGPGSRQPTAIDPTHFSVQSAEQQFNLPPAQAQAMVELLVGDTGYTPDQIAETFNLTPQQVDNFRRNVLGQSDQPPSRPPGSITQAPLSERNAMAADEDTARRSGNQQLRFQQAQAGELGADIDAERGGRLSWNGPSTTAQRREFARTNPATVRAGGGRNRSAPSQARRSGFDFGGWDNMIQQRDQTYGADYGRAAAAAFLLQQQGVTPLQQQLAARRQVPIGMGLAGSGYLPGVG